MKKKYLNLMLTEKIVSKIDLTDDGTRVTLNNGRVGDGEVGSNQYKYNIYMDEGDRYQIDFRTLTIKHNTAEELYQIETIQEIMNK